MFSTPNHPEIDHNTIRLLIGVIAVLLAFLPSFFSGGEITSISAAYHEDGWARDFFVGFLFAITGFMLSYNGRTRNEMRLSKVAAFAAFGVAMFPCGCGSHAEIIPYVHYISATVMFLILAYFCNVFRKRATSKGHTEAIWRAWIYVVCGSFLALSMLTMAIDFISNQSLSDIIPRLTFYSERTGLIAFGVSWLTASKFFPGVSSRDERIHPFN